MVIITKVKIINLSKRNKNLNAKICKNNKSWIIKYKIKHKLNPHIINVIGFVFSLEISVVNGKQNYVSKFRKVIRCGLVLLFNSKDTII